MTHHIAVSPADSVMCLELCWVEPWQQCSAKQLLLGRVQASGPHAAGEAFRGRPSSLDQPGLPGPQDCGGWRRGGRSKRSPVQWDADVPRQPAQHDFTCTEASAVPG